MANWLEGLDDVVFGGARDNRLRVEERHKAKMAQMAELLKTQQGRTLLLKAQAAAMKEGRSIYGTYGRRGTTTDPIERAGKIGTAITRMDNAGFFVDNEELRDSLTAYATKDLPGADYKKPMDTEVDIAGLLTGNLADIPQKTKRKWYDDTISEEARNDAVKKSVNELVRKHGYSQEQATSVIQDEINSKMGKEKGKAFTVLPESPVDVRGLFSEGVSPFGPAIGDITSYDMHTKKPRTVATEEGIMPLGDYFQAATETIPEENIPRTYEQLGITDTEDQATLQEMQDAIPERDLRQEYEDDPEGMKRLMKLWREKKLTKQNLRKAFSVIQSKARQSLGIA